MNNLTQRNIDTKLKELNGILRYICRNVTSLNNGYMAYNEYLAERKISSMNTQKFNLILRPWNMDDLDNIVIFANNNKIADNLTDAFPHPYTREDGIAYIKTFGEHPDRVNDPVRVFAIEVNGIACGSIGIFPQSDVHRKNAEMGYWLAEEYWGSGIMTVAVKNMVEYGFSTFDITRIFARPFSSNIASQRVLEKAGMKLEGRFEKSLFKNGQFLDELIYSTLKPYP
jgi:RimJ/RimL family protein N-acetyltransferase